MTGAKLQAVASAEEFHAILAEGKALRSTAPTIANAASSRSHAFCEIEVELGAALPGLLRVVDLAGSERSVEAHKHSEERRREMRQINSSLGTLKECIRCAVRAARARAMVETAKTVAVEAAEATAEVAEAAAAMTTTAISAAEEEASMQTSAKAKVAKRVFFPFRNSKLTMLLRDVFVDEAEGGAGDQKEEQQAGLEEGTAERRRHRVAFLAHLQPLRSRLRQTLNTCSYTMFSKFWTNGEKR